MCVAFLVFAGWSGGGLQSQATWHACMSANNTPGVLVTCQGSPKSCTAAAAQQWVFCNEQLVINSSDHSHDLLLSVRDA
jgi:hypothetical protein